MPLQRINWTQIDSANVPSGSTVYIGSMSTPVDGVYTNKLFIGEQGNQDLLHDFFFYLSGYTGFTGFATLSTNVFNGDQMINGSVYVLNDGNSDNYIIVSGITGSTEINNGFIILRGPNDETSAPYIALISTDPVNKSSFYTYINGFNSDINPWDGPIIAQINNLDLQQSIIGFQSYTGWTDGRVTFFTPVEMSSGLTVTGDTIVQGNINIVGGDYLINGQPFSGGTSGSSGTSGIDGTSGSSGSSGTSGSSGLTGSSGTGGSSGTSGEAGSSGTSGIDGTSGTSGTGGTSGTSGAGAELSVADNTGLGIISGFTGDTIYTIYNTTLDSSLAMPTAVGGITIGTTVSQLTGKTIVQLFNDLLFPTVEPTYTVPTITMTGLSNQTLEAGSTFAPNISLYGNKNDAGPFTQLRILRNSSPISTYTGAGLTQSSITDISPLFGYTDPNNPNYRYTINPTPYSESYVLPSGASATTTYYGDGNYNSGLVKKDNKGNDDTSAYAVRLTTAPQLSGNTFATGTYVITSIFPYFYGTSVTLPDVNSIASAISGGTATAVLSAASGTLSIPYNCTSLYIWFAYQNSYTTKTVWYVNALDNGSIDGSFITTVATKTANSPSGYWSGITFKMHWSVYGTTQTTIEFRNS